MSKNMGATWSHFRTFDDAVVAFVLLAISSFVSASSPATTLLTTSTKGTVVVSQEEIFISAGVCALGILIFFLGLIALIIAVRRYCNSTASHDIIHCRGKTYSRRSLRDPSPYIIEQRASRRSTYLSMGRNNDHSPPPQVLSDVDLHSMHAYRQAVQRQIIRDLQRMAGSETPLVQGFQTLRNHSAPNVYEDLERGHAPTVFAGGNVDTPGYTSVGTQRHVHFSDCHYSRPRNMSLPHHFGHEIYEDMGGSFCPANRGHHSGSRSSLRREMDRSLAGHGVALGYPWDISPPSPLLDRSAVPKREDEHCSIENCENDAVHQHGNLVKNNLAESPSSGNPPKQAMQLKSPEEMTTTVELESVENTNQDGIWSKPFYTKPDLSKKTKNREPASDHCLGDVSIEESDE